MVAIDAGALDIAVDDDVFEIVTEPADLRRGARARSRTAGVAIDSAEVAQLPSSRVPVEEERAPALMRLDRDAGGQRRRQRGARQLRRQRRRHGAGRGLADP